VTINIKMETRLPDKDQSFLLLDLTNIIWTSQGCDPSLDGIEPDAKEEL
jgi:hypothetical protein